MVVGLEVTELGLINVKCYYNLNIPGPCPTGLHLCPWNGFSSYDEQEIDEDTEFWDSYFEQCKQNGSEDFGVLTMDDGSECCITVRRFCPDDPDDPYMVKPGFDVTENTDDADCPNGIAKSTVISIRYDNEIDDDARKYIEDALDKQKDADETLQYTYQDYNAAEYSCYKCKCPELSKVADARDEEEKLEERFWSNDSDKCKNKCNKSFSKADYEESGCKDNDCMIEFCKKKCIREWADEYLGASYTDYLSESDTCEFSCPIKECADDEVCVNSGCTKWWRISAPSSEKTEFDNYVLEKESYFKETYDFSFDPNEQYYLFTNRCAECHKIVTACPYGNGPVDEKPDENSDICGDGYTVDEVKGFLFKDDNGVSYKYCYTCMSTTECKNGFTKHELDGTVQQFSAYDAHEACRDDDYKKVRDWYYVAKGDKFACLKCDRPMCCANYNPVEKDVKLGNYGLYDILNEGKKQSADQDLKDQYYKYIATHDVFKINDGTFCSMTWHDEHDDTVSDSGDLYFDKRMKDMRIYKEECSMCSAFTLVHYESLSNKDTYVLTPTNYDSSGQPDYTSRYTGPLCTGENCYQGTAKGSSGYYILPNNDEYFECNMDWSYGDHSINVLGCRDRCLNSGVSKDSITIGIVPSIVKQVY